MKIERLYYTVEQLAAHWDCSIDDVMQLGLTEQLAFTAQIDMFYPFTKTTRYGEHTPVDFETLAQIHHATKPFTLSGMIKESINDDMMQGHDVDLIFYNGISRLIINTSEVKRFENEQNQSNSDAPPLEMNDDAHAAFLEFWNIEPYPHITNKTVENWLIENRNVSPTKAASIATYIRPKSAPKGRPKKK